jgi:hypothetical protein
MCSSSWWWWWWWCCFVVAALSELEVVKTESMLAPRIENFSVFYNFINISVEQDLDIFRTLEKLFLYLDCIS